VLPLSQSTVSQHLKVLKEAGWITGTIDGPRTCYALNQPAIEALRLVLGPMLEQWEGASTCSVGTSLHLNPSAQEAHMPNGTGGCCGGGCCGGGCC